MTRSVDRATKSSAREYYDDCSRSYDASRVGRYHDMIDRIEVELAEPFVRNSSVLELGCGTGRVLQKLSETAAKAVGVDISAGMIEWAKGRGLDARIADLCDLPFEDGEFDVVCSYKVLAHVPNIMRALEEATRVTRSGGHLLLEFYNPWSLRFIVKRVGGARPISDSRTEADVFTRWDSPLAIRALLPKNLDLIDYYGVRVVTPLAAAHRISWLSEALTGIELRASRSMLRYFGGFLVAVLRKRS